MVFIKHDCQKSDIFFNPITAWKASKYGIFSGPHFLSFGLNTKRSRKIWTRKKSVLGHFSRSAYLFYVFNDPCFSGSMFFKVQVFLGPGFRGYRISYIQVFCVQVFQGPGSGSRVWVQVLEVAVTMNQNVI